MSHQEIGKFAPPQEDEIQPFNKAIAKYNQLSAEICAKMQEIHAQRQLEKVELDELKDMVQQLQADCKDQSEQNVRLNDQLLDEQDAKEDAFNFICHGLSVDIEDTKQQVLLAIKGCPQVVTNEVSKLFVILHQSPALACAAARHKTTHK